MPLKTAQGTQGVQNGSYGGNIPLTEGQRTGNLAQIAREEGQRQGRYGVAAQGTLRQFDDTQQTAIRNEAQDLQGRIGAGTGLESENVAALGDKLQQSLITARDTSKAGVRAAYDAANQTPATLSREGIGEFNRRLKSTMAEWPVRGMPQVRQLMNEVQTFTGWKNITGVNMKGIELWRKRVSKLAQSNDPQLAGAAIAMKGTLDDYLDEALMSGLLSGDDAALSAFKGARGTHAAFARMFGKGKNDPAGNAMVQILDTNRATPEQVINFFTGSEKITSTAKSVGLVKRMKEIFGPESDEIKMLKDAFLLKAFTKCVQGQREVTPAKIVVGATEFLRGEGLTLGKQLFTPAEYRQIARFTTVVRKTLTPNDAQNPSRSAWVILQALQDRNLLSHAGRGVKVLPMMDEMGKGIENVGGAISARNAVSQIERLTSHPLVEAGATAAAVKSTHAIQDQHSRVPLLPGPMAGNTVVPLQQKTDPLHEALMGKTYKPGQSRLADELMRKR